MIQGTLTALIISYFSISLVYMSRLYKGTKTDPAPMKKFLCFLLLSMLWPLTKLGD